jgi:hypothetical protein
MFKVVPTFRPISDIITYFHSLTSMPGLDFFTKRSEPKARRKPSPVSVDVDTYGESRTGMSTPQSTLFPRSPQSAVFPGEPDVYYNARLDPQNYLEGPLSWNPATRLRQMLARPGIVVRKA